MISSFCTISTPPPPHPPPTPKKKELNKCGRQGWRHKQLCSATPLKYLLLQDRRLPLCPPRPHPSVSIPHRDGAPSPHSFCHSSQLTVLHIPPPFLYYPRLPLTATHRPPFPTPYSPFPTVPLWVHLHPSRHPLSSIPHPHSAPTPLFPIPHCPLIDTPPPLLTIHCPPFPTLSLEENKCFRTLVSNFLILICYLF